MKIEVELSDEQIAWLRIAADQGQYAGRLRRLMESLTDALPKSVVVSVELGPALAKLPEGTQKSTTSSSRRVARNQPAK